MTPVLGVLHYSFAGVTYDYPVPVYCMNDDGCITALPFAKFMIDDNSLFLYPWYCRVLFYVCFRLDIGIDTCSFDLFGGFSLPSFYI